MTIKVQVKSVYGVDKTYPVCEKATLLAKLAGTRTLTDSALRVIQALGYDIEGA